MNLVSLLIASAVVSMGVGKDQNDALRIIIALVAVAIIVVAVYVSKQREVAIGSEDAPPPPPPAPPTGEVDPAGATRPRAYAPTSPPPSTPPPASPPPAEPMATQRFEPPTTAPAPPPAPGDTPGAGVVGGCGPDRPTEPATGQPPRVGRDARDPLRPPHPAA